MFEAQYKNLIKNILSTKNTHSNRINVPTKKIFGVQLKMALSNGFPILTGKKINFNSIKYELEWVLTGRVDLKFLHEKKIFYWDANAKNGELGPIYGHQLCNYNSQNFNQLQNILSELKNNPYSRRLVVSFWNPLQLNDMALPPCHYSFQLNVENIDNYLYMDLLWNQRSADVFLGLPYDIAMYALLLVLFANYINATPRNLIGSLADAHIYTNHLEEINYYLSAPTYGLPELYCKETFPKINFENIKLIDYKSNSYIKTILNV